MSDVKTLNDVKLDMSELYEAVKNGEIELKLASELANIAGKFLKAEHLRPLFIWVAHIDRQLAEPEQST
jgi:hypothetical protein